MQQPNQQMQTVLDTYAKLGPLPVETLSAENARKLPTLVDAVFGLVSEHILVRAAAPFIEPVGKIKHVRIPVEDGEIIARVYTPTTEGPYPVIVYYHGGGWVIGNPDVYDSSCRALCNGVGAVIVSVAYRLSPEHKFPTAHNDAHAAKEWVMQNIQTLNGIQDKVAIAGESAGGNLATSVCMMSRDKGTMMPVHQLLVYPITDLSKESSTYKEYEEAKPLSASMMRWFKETYISSPEDVLNPYLSPLLGNVSGMPAATVILAEIDPLRAEGQAYAEKLQHAGIATTITCYTGVTHEFFGMKGVLNESKQALEEAITELKKVLQK